MIPSRRLVALLLSVLLSFATLSLATGPAHAADKDCGDFDTQAAAQKFFINAGGPKNDPHRLDADGDGIACESLPCPCSTDKGGTGGGDAGANGGPTKKKRVTQHGKIVKVVDGDTVDVRLKSGKKKRIRVIGIDTPEVHGTTECMGPEASENAKKSFRRGTRVILYSDTSQDLEDRYGRLLRYVVRKKGSKDLGKLQLRAGLARVYVYDKTPFVRVKSYRRVQTAAKKAGSGIWGEC